VRVVDWERRGSEGGAPRKGRRAVAPTKSQRMTGLRCSGELWECHLGKAARGSGGSGVDERRTGQKRGTGWRPTFVLKAARWRGQRGKRVGVGVDASMWRREKEETGRGGGLVRWSVARGGRQWPPTVGRGWRHCHANRGGRRAWATRAKVADERDRGEVGPGGSGRGAREKERERRAAVGR
jgi:hypothetical protein